MTELHRDGQEKRFRYRVTVFGRPRDDAPWRATKDHAFDDAIALGLASTDNASREHYLAVPVAIESELLPRMSLSTRKDSRPWTTDDIATLRELAPTMDWPKDIGKRLARTGEAVTAKARRLGIEVRTKTRDEIGQRAVTEALPEKPRWVPRELRGRDPALFGARPKRR